MMQKLRKLMARTKKSKSIDGPKKSEEKEKKPLSLKEEEDTFVVHNIEEGEEEETEPAILRESTVVTEEPKVAEKVVVKFSNFVNLVANHNYEDVIQKNQDEEVIMSSDLLADLANAHEQEEERRIPAIFIIGVVLGVIITYILLTF